MEAAAAGTATPEQIELLPVGHPAKVNLDAAGNPIVPWTQRRPSEIISEVEIAQPSRVRIRRFDDGDVFLEVVELSDGEEARTADSSEVPTT